MLKVINKDNKDIKVIEKISKKLKLEHKDYDLISYDKFLISYIFILAIKDKTVYLLSSDKKGTETFNIKDIDKVLVDKKTDLNLYIKGGRVINLTSVVGIKPKVAKTVKLLQEEINNLR